MCFYHNGEGVEGAGKHSTIWPLAKERFLDDDARRKSEFGSQRRSTRYYSGRKRNDRFVLIFITQHSLYFQTEWCLFLSARDRVYATSLLHPVPGM